MDIEGMIGIGKAMCKLSHERDEELKKLPKKQREKLKRESRQRLFKIAKALEVKNEWYNIS